MPSLEKEILVINPARYATRYGLDLANCAGLLPQWDRFLDHADYDPSHGNAAAERSNEITKGVRSETPVTVQVFRGIIHPDASTSSDEDGYPGRWLHAPALTFPCVSYLPLLAKIGRSVGDS